ncbi:Leucine rich repeat N-terminal domain [Seminavis robusta]|uniref:Leucine rich repeat N-terminal domain n=1 Tax=Seminavis robusta TaxID=568900 RepID=A0A9N8E117_9STRA|nr:Leucine rich repeat N-terminal domain [Seminavis robusta]|eukprot:Sro540_g163030.1 Leucine rich repeat N-terminal domain (809) ;mRNA; r:43212-45859
MDAASSTRSIDDDKSGTSSSSVAAAESRDEASMEDGDGIPTMTTVVESEDAAVPPSTKAQLLKEIELFDGNLAPVKKRNSIQHDNDVHPVVSKDWLEREFSYLQRERNTTATTCTTVSKTGLEREMEALSLIGTTRDDALPVLDGSNTSNNSNSSNSRPRGPILSKEQLEAEMAELGQAMPVPMLIRRSTVPVVDVPSARVHVPSRTSHARPGAYASRRISATADPQRPRPQLPQSSTRSLVEANPVEEEEENNPIVVVMAHPQETHNKKLHYVEGISTLLVALVLILIAIASLCGNGFCSSNNNPVVVLTTEEERLAVRIETVAPQIKEFLQDALKNDNYFLGQEQENAASLIHQDKFVREARQLAFEWMVRDDPLELTHDDGQHLLQRFLLVLLYYQTTRNHPWVDCNPTINIDTTTGTTTTTSWQRCWTDRISVTPRGRLRMGTNQWLSNNHECQWAGVSCREGGSNQIVALALTMNELNGPMPRELSLLSNLVELDMSDNLLTGTLHSTFLTDFGPSLQQINLQQNQMTGTIPNEWFATASIIRALDRLTSVSLSRNLLTGTIPDDTTRRALQTLSIQDNMISGSLPRWIFKNVNLQYLMLSGNAITGTLHTEVGKLQRLNWLQLQGTKLSGTLPSEIGLLNRLQDLSLSYTFLNGSLPEELYTGCTNLHELDINDSDFSGTIGSSLDRLTNLGRLDIANNQFQGRLPANLSALTSIYQVYINGNGLTGTMPQSLCHNLIEYGWALDMKAQADCFTDPSTGSTAILCDCCTTCCDPNTGICFLSDFGRVSSWERNRGNRQLATS